MYVNQEHAFPDGARVALSNPRSLLGAKIAVQANNPDNVPRIMDRIFAFSSNPLVDDTSIRLAMLNQARALMKALETLRKTMIKYNLAQVYCKTRNNFSRIIAFNSRTVLLL